MTGREPDDEARAIRAQIDELAREVYADDVEGFMATPRRSLGNETPSALIARGELEPVLEILIDALYGHFD